MTARATLQFDAPAAILTIWFVVCASSPLAACKGNSEKGEAANVIRVVTDLRMADNENKQGPLEQLRALPCTSGSVCETRDACVEAFDHHVRGVQLGARLRRHLGSDSGAEGADAGDATALLLEMNLEVEEGRKAMPACEQRVASLRREHKL